MYHVIQEASSLDAQCLHCLEDIHHLFSLHTVQYIVQRHKGTCTSQAVTVCVCMCVCVCVCGL